MSGSCPAAAEPVHDEHHDCLIIGAGPAGLQLGYFLERAGCDYRILEAADQVAPFFVTYPRSRRLISFNKVNGLYDDPEIRLRWDWNSLLTDDYATPFSDFSTRLYPHADELCAYLAAFAKEYALRISPGSRVTRISRGFDGRGFEILLDGGQRLTARYVVVATGVSQPFVPAIPGIELAEGYESVPLAPDEFRGQRILILGKGNSAFEVADAAMATAALVHVASPTPLQLAWRSRHPGHVRADYLRLMDMYQLKLLNGALDCVVQDIRRVPRGLAVSIAYVHADDERETLCYDRVIRCTGFRFDASIFDPQIRPELVFDERLPAQTTMWESVTVPDLFFAGTLMQAIDFKSASSAFIDGFRYNIRTLAGHLLARYHGVQPSPPVWPTRPDLLAERILERASRTSGLWTQFGFLCDSIVIHQCDGEPVAIVHHELPRDHVRDVLCASEPHHYTLTFEWGRWSGDVFAIDRHPRSAMAHTNVFLHPVLRRFRGRELLAVHHILEDLFATYHAESASGMVLSRSQRSIADYHAEEHQRPLERFFAEQL
jgi:Pyridine nucleotide-disulphide oxidoreductase